MKIETKFNIGDDVYFLDINKVKLVKGTVISVKLFFNSEGIENEYQISIAPYCTTASEIIDDLTDWLGGNKNDIYLSATENLLFESKEAFMSFISTEEIIVPTPNNTIVKGEIDGNTKEHSEQHKSNEQVVQRRQSDY